MNPNKALWEKGDFTRIATSIRDSGEELVSRLGITKGLKVMDLGCGDGTTAVPAARLGAEVLELISRATSSKPGIVGPRKKASPTSGSRRAMHLISVRWMPIRSISS